MCRYMNQNNDQSATIIWPVACARVGHGMSVVSVSGDFVHQGAVLLAVFSGKPEIISHSFSGSANSQTTFIFQFTNLKPRSFPPELRIREMFSRIRIQPKKSRVRIRIKSWQKFKVSKFLSFFLERKLLLISFVYQKTH